MAHSVVKMVAENTAPPTRRLWRTGPEGGSTLRPFLPWSHIAADSQSSQRWRTEPCTVRQHIATFPAMESHYCRQSHSSQRKFLDSTLNVDRMYQTYAASMKEHVQPVSSSLYRDIFNTDFNLSFHTPKKDQCLVCQI